MLVQWLGEPSGPDFIAMRGFTFERKGEPVEVPDNHAAAKQFRENHYFKVQETVKEVAADQADDDRPNAPKAATKPKVTKLGRKPKADPTPEPVIDPKTDEELQTA